MVLWLQSSAYALEPYKEFDKGYTLRAPFLGTPMISIDFSVYAISLFKALEICKQKGIPTVLI